MRDATQGRVMIKVIASSPFKQWSVPEADLLDLLSSLHRPATAYDAAGQEIAEVVHDIEYGWVPRYMV